VKDGGDKELGGTITVGGIVYLNSFFCSEIPGQIALPCSGIERAAIEFALAGAIGPPCSTVIAACDSIDILCVVWGWSRLHSTPPGYHSKPLGTLMSPRRSPRPLSLRTFPGILVMGGYALVAGRGEDGRRAKGEKTVML